MDQNIQKKTASSNNILSIFTPSDMQKGLLNTVLMEESSQLYVEQSHMRVKGTFDIDIFEKTWQLLINRHDSLRSAFVWDKLRDIQQVILKDVNFSINQHDVRHLPEAQQQKHIADFLEQDAQNGFKFTTPPLLRISVFRCKDDQYDVIITIHHTIMDGWSMLILAQEMLYIYTSLVEGNEIQLNEAVSYKKYISWLNQLNLQPAEQFWSKKLTELDNLCNLPRSLASTNLSAQREYKNQIDTIDNQLSAKLKAFCSQNQLTENSFVSACWAILLNHYCSNKTITFGCVHSDRSLDLEGSQEIVGPLINILPIIISVDRQLNSIEFIHSVQNQLFEYYENANLSYSKILSLLSNKQHTKQFDHHLFDTFIAYEKFNQDAENNIQDNLGFELEFFETAERINFPLALKTNLREIKLIYYSDYISDHYAQNISKLFLKIMANIVEQPQNKLDTLLRDITADYPLLKGPITQSEFSLNQRIHYFAAEHPQQNALDDTQTILTYQQLSSKIKQIASNLNAQQGEIIGVVADRSMASFLGMLAIMECGACYLPLDTSYPEERIKYMIENSQVKRIISTGQLLNFTDIEMLHFDELNLARNPIKEFIIEDDLPAYIIYTSGSTGKPKGTLIPYKGLKYLVQACGNILTEPHQKVIHFASMSFDGSIFELVLAMNSGGCSCIIPNQYRTDIQMIKQYINQQKITVAQLPPVVIASFKQSELPDLKILMSAGDICPATVAEEWSKSNLFYNLYGPSEASVFATYNPVHLTKNSSAIGFPCPNSEIRILDEDHISLPAGAIGGLWIFGDGVAQGYLHNPELSEKFFIHGGYATGDYGFYDNNGLIHYVGRKDNQVQLRGHRIELGEIEEVFCSKFNINEAIALLDETKNNTTLHIFILQQEAQKLTEKEMLSILRESLPSYMIPNEIHQLDHWSVTPNQKIDRSYYQQFLNQQKSKAKQASPSVISETEDRVITEIASALALDKSTLSIDDDFFKLGGNSLTATTLILHLNKTFEVTMPFQIIFDNSTVAQLANIIDNLLTDKDNPNKKTIKVNTDDFEADYQLDQAISLNNAKPFDPAIIAHPKTIFLTGVTGFVGSYLLRELLNATDAQIICLVRSDNQQNAQQRVIDALKKNQIYHNIDENRIHAVVGDLALDNFGLDGDTIEQLAQQIDVIFHCGANVNLLQTYNKMVSDNVKGSNNIIAFAAKSKIKPIHHISTLSVFAGIIGKQKAIYEDDEITTKTLPDSGYIRSKWVAEKMMINARKLGLPVNIYRLPRVWGDTKTGNSNPQDALLLVLKAAIEIKDIPILPKNIDSFIVPVDYIAQLVTNISKNINDTGENYHVLYPITISMDGVIDKIRERGYELNDIPLKTWIKKVNDLSREANSSKTVQSAAALILDNADEQGERTHIDCSNIQKYNDIKDILSVSALLDRYIDYLIEVE